MTVRVWEYKTVHLSFRQKLLMKQGELETILNEHGQEGWELVQYDTGVNRLIFKRAKGFD